MEDINEMMPTETAEEIDSAWNDEDGSSAEFEAEPEVNQPTAQQEGMPASGNGGDQTAVNQSQQALGNQQEPYMIPYTFNGENLKMDAAEAAPWIQMGKNYAPVREERDRLRQFRQEAEPAYTLVKDYAEKNGMTVPQYLEALRKNDLMNRGMSEQEAEREISYENRKAALDAQEKVINAHKQQQEAAVQAQRSKQERVQRETADFLNAFPDVKVSELPREVWDEVAKGVPMVTAYTMHENKRLQAELAAERQNNANRQRTPGSLGGNAAAEMDEIDRLWYEDD